ncbi:cell division protein FtsZ [Phaeocystidibacter luteus]|uniref:Cell division protein FtsZ n=1 Tax=Phaeocystidibacter luteus TaxID=911197 RepID=A0A6N6RH75_9FLAO|nr:cell division protein FtsZ [Phaeocystidibacter luteus]KAB2813653.1 cell division protein FtsZ [Phaeocystidibacter luteus]
MEEGLNFDLPKNRSSVIKVIGVGGGGSNAVNHMKRLGINGVDFVVCNTDAQALEHSPVENRIQLGANLTEGLGAGANPEVGERAALETVEEIKEVLGHNTKMLFITAGMGGGTGTGAAPIIARVAQELGILTVGIVTIPFAFEGKIRLQQAKHGIEKFKQHLDSLIVINNNKLREVYGNLGFKAGFAKADEVLATAAKGIAEVITHHYTANIDLKDAKTVLANSGTAIMGSAKASGQTRAMDAIRGALDSPLLNDNHIVGAKNVLLLIVCGSDDHEITFDEIGEVNDYIQNEAGGDANIIMGIGQDEELGDAVSITIIATGFSAQATVQPFTRAPERVVHTLDDAPATDQPISEKPEQEKKPEEPKQAVVQRGLFDLDEPQAPAQPEAIVDPMDQPIPEVEPTPEVIGETINETIDEEIQVETPKPTAEAVMPEVSTPEAEIEDIEEPAESNSTEERVVFELGDFELDAETDFVIEDEPSAEPEVEEEPVAETEEVDVFDFSIDEAFTGETAEEASMEWDVVNTNESEPEVTSEEENIPSQEHYEEVRFNLNDEIEEEQAELPRASEEPQPKQKGDRVVHTLDDLRELEQRLGMSSSQTKVEKPKEEEDEALKFEVRQAESKPAAASSQTEADPLERPIEEAMRQRNEERSQRLKQFNYKFQNLQSNLIDSEKEPAYKRQGVEIDHSRQSTQSRMGGTSIGGDGDDLEFRSNNSFLHDNVD